MPKQSSARPSRNQKSSTPGFVCSGSPAASRDFLYQANRHFVDMLKGKGVKVLYRETEGSHVWSVWRNYLNETAPMLFTDLRGKK